MVLEGHFLILFTYTWSEYSGNENLVQTIVGFLENFILDLGPIWPYIDLEN